MVIAFQAEGWTDIKVVETSQTLGTFSCPKKTEVARVWPDGCDYYYFETWPGALMEDLQWALDACF